MLAPIHPTTTTPLPPQRLEELVDSFIQAQDVRPNSRELYRRTLKQYLRWVYTKGYLFSEIASPQLYEYKQDLLLSQKSALTIGSYLTSVKRFYEFTEANRLYPNIAKNIKPPKRLRQFRKQPLLPSQVTDLLEYTRSASKRDYAIISLLVRTGLRTIEVVRANVEDIVYKGGKRVLLVQGKGRDEKDEYVVLTEKSYAPIREYLETRGKLNPKEPLFLSFSNCNKGERLTTRTISKLAKESLKGIGLEDKMYTAHSLRHTAIVTTRRAGGTQEQGQALARHKSPTTTQEYDSFFREEDRLKNSAEELIDTLY